MASPLASAVSTIAEKTAVLSHLLGSQNIAQPTFEEQGHGAYSGENVALRRARYELVRAAQDLVRLAQGPEDQILQLAWSGADNANLAVLLRFDVPQNVPLGSTISGAELAAKVGLPEDILLRTMRYAVACSGLFVEGPRAGFFGHSAASAELARRENLRDIANVSTQELSKILLGLPEALALQRQAAARQAGGGGGHGHALDSKDGGREVPGDSDRAGGGSSSSTGGDAELPPPPEAAFNVTFPGYRNVFEFLAKNPAVSERYHRYMVGRATTARWSAANLAGAWDWGSVGARTIADVGGSAGQTCLSLAAACPEAKFVVLDVDPVALEHGRQMLAAAGLAGRTSFVQYDFLAPKDAVSADIYLFRHIFHDWPDADVVRILKNTVAGLRDGASVLVSEGILPPPPVRRANTLDERQIFVEDLFMLSVHTGRERSVDDFIRLFKEADPRFEYVETTGGVDGAFQSVVAFKFKT